MEQKENIFVFLCICMSWPGLWLDVPMHGFTSEISNTAVIAGDRVKHVGCSIWLKTPPINIQLQNLKPDCLSSSYLISDLDLTL